MFINQSIYISRSAISVFPSKQSGKDCRIWNTEYICYAGFEVSPGQVIGDPAHVELTNICLQLGWKPKISRYVFFVCMYAFEIFWKILVATNTLL